MAIPFDMPAPDPDSPLAHFLRIQNLLRELLTLLRRMPSRMIGDPINLYPYSNLNISSPSPPPHSQEERDRLWEQQRQISVNAYMQRRRERQLQRQQQSQEQQPLLPDLVTSCGQSASLPPSPPPSPTPPQQQQQQQQQQLLAQRENEDDDRLNGAVKLQIAVCPTCYYGKERKLKVIAVAKLDENGNPIRWTKSCDDEEPVVVENKCSNVKRRIMSFFQQSKIESSVLTAMFVIIGWKMFIKQ